MDIKDKFKPISSAEIIKILGITIKKDNVNKLITFLAQVSAFTSDAQINISFNAPSSTGKSFIPLEIANLFPTEDLLELGSASPTSFYHEQGEYDKDNNTIKVDLSRKIIIFLDQPNPALLKRLRSLLSHDRKEIISKITDKNQKGGNRTKTVVMIGFPVVIFCSASLEMDEQESTRFFLLSPEINEEKIREAIIAKIRRGSNISKFNILLESREDRKLLKERILAIKNEHIEEIKISNPTLIEELFIQRVSKSFKPRHPRDIGRIINLVKIFALLNFMYRGKEGKALIAEEEDIMEAFKIWDSISQSQELNLPPYVLSIFIDVIAPAYKEAKPKAKQESNVEVDLFNGISYQQILQKHFDVFGRYLPLWQLRQQIIPPLETSGLITQGRDLVDKRKVLITPTTALTIHSDENNSEESSGVTDNED